MTDHTLQAECAFAQSTQPLSASFINRIRAAYRHAMVAEPVATSPLWSMIRERNQDIHELLFSERDPAPALDAPTSNNLFYGFDNLYKDFTDQIKNDRAFQNQFKTIFIQELILLAEATGAKRAWNPEGGSLYPYRDKPPVTSLEELLDTIEERVGFKVDFPNPFPDEFGLYTSRGILSQRTIHTIYYAWRLKLLAQHYGGRVLEIGAGLGRTAYYARHAGIHDYTIVDLPHTNAAQANFLGRVLGERDVSLYKEPQNGRVRIMPPQWLQETSERFDIVLNTDSLTEMEFTSATDYAEWFVRRGKILLSINHEGNIDTVIGLTPLKGRLIGRFPYWIREGYMEETFVGGLSPKQRLAKYIEKLSACAKQYLRL